jgi:hypothetical protein
MHLLETQNELKINGILFQQDITKLVDVNVDKALKKTEKILAAWATRSLTTLGKILILKTFAVSQFVFLMQSLVLNEHHFKKIRQILYKFIWNRHFMAAKAPERIRREIVNTPIKLGGYGMIEVSELDMGIKLRAIGRLFNTKHPLLIKVKEKLNTMDPFNVKLTGEVEPFVVKGLGFLNKLRQSYLGSQELASNRKYIAILRNQLLSSVVNRTGRNSIGYLVLRNKGHRRIGELNLIELNSIRPFIELTMYRELLRVHNLIDDTSILNNLSWIFKSGKEMDMSLLTSKELRNLMVTHDPICLPKIGAIVGPNEVVHWGHCITRLSSVKHRNLILRVAHGEVYTKEKLCRIGLIESPNCTRCDSVETLQHKIFECEYTQRIWNLTLNLTRHLNTSSTDNVDRDKLILGMDVGSTPTTMTIHAEVINRIMSLKDEARFLLRPNIIVKLALQYLIKNEKAESVKNSIEELLNRLPSERN